jgi:hypothetical protein
MTHDEQPPGHAVSPDAEGGADELTCEEAARSVFEYLDGELPPDYSEKVHRHVEMCRRCYPYFNFERAFLDYVHDRGMRPARSAELEARLHRLLRELDEREP